MSSSDRSKILQHDEIVFKCNFQWSICGRNTQHEIPTGHTLLRCHFQGQFCHFRFHVATALEIYSNISSLWSPGNCLLQHVIRTKPICSLRVSAAIFLLRKKSRLPTYQKLLIEALRSCLLHVSLRLLPTHSTSPSSSSRANKWSRECVEAGLHQSRTSKTM